MKTEREYKVDSMKAAEWFPLDHSISCKLGIFERLFGLVFKEMETSGEMVWHEVVKLFAVWNEEAEGGEFRGYI